MSEPTNTRRRVRFEYACWNVQWWMERHQPRLPRRLVRRLMPLFDPRRHHVGRQQYDFWLRGGHDPARLPRPLPWPICPNFEGPLLRPWRRVQRWFRGHTGGRSHRCEFTDPAHGALHGHDEGAFMDRYFDGFLRSIEPEDARGG